MSVFLLTWWLLLFLVLCMHSKYSANDLVPWDLELWFMIALVRTLKAILHSPPFYGAPWMLWPSAVHVSSTFEFGAMFHDCLSADPQGNPPFYTFLGAPWMLLPSAVHVSSTFEFTAMIHDCLSADPQGNPPFSPFFEAPWMLLPSVVHASSTFEFGAMFHDCLSVDHQVQSFILPFFRIPMNVIA